MTPRAKAAQGRRARPAPAAAPAAEPAAAPPITTGFFGRVSQQWAVDPKTTSNNISKLTGLFKVAIEGKHKKIRRG
eukprot:10864346-Alexandrium_andersonii.AAC.1